MTRELVLCFSDVILVLVLVLVVVVMVMLMVVVNGDVLLLRHSACKNHTASVLKKQKFIFANPVQPGLNVCPYCSVRRTGTYFGDGTP